MLIVKELEAKLSLVKTSQYCGERDIMILSAKLSILKPVQEFVMAKLAQLICNVGCMFCGKKKMAQKLTKTEEIEVNGRTFFITTDHPLYKLRDRMKRRCYNAKKQDFKYYQGKGIKICDEWLNSPRSFYQWCLENFWEQGLTIDRIDSNGNYEPNNCRFVTLAQNSLNINRLDNLVGQNHHQAVLNDEKVREIKSMFKLKLTNKALAEKFNTCASNIQSIRANKTWKHIKI